MATGLSSYTEGGLGVRRVGQLALPSYLSVVFQTRELQEEMLSNCPHLEDPYLAEALNHWLSSCGPVPPPGRMSSQAAWDEMLIREDKAQVSNYSTSPREKAIFLAASFPHSGDWLSALPLASCGLRLYDEAIRVGVALRLGTPLCSPHDCRCGAKVDPWGTHAFTCKKAPGRIMGHHALNDIVARALTTAEKPVHKEPPGLMSASGKRPDGISLLSWKNGKRVAWDVTVATTLADSYLAASSSRCGSAASLISARKDAKYQGLPAEYMFYPLAFENLGPTSAE